MTITVANFITQYLRPALASSADWSDATLGYWIDAALLDISRNFPRRSYAWWEAVAGQQTYLYANSLTVADENTIIRLVSCLYPYDLVELSGPPMAQKSHLEEDFLGGSYYEADSTAQILYIGATLITAENIYSDAHIYWKTAAGTIINPSEHYELIRLFVIWQAFLHQTADLASNPVPDPAMLNALALEASRASIAYRETYDKLNAAKATSGYTEGWAMDKWDSNTGEAKNNPGQLGFRRTGWGS